MNIKPHEFKQATIGDIEMDLGFVEDVLEIVSERIILPPEDPKEVLRWVDGLYSIIEYVKMHVSSIRSAAACIFVEEHKK